MTAAGVFAAKAEVCPGWTVERVKGRGLRTVTVKRPGDPGEMFSFTWRLKPETGNMVLDHGEHVVGDVQEDWDNLTAAVRVMKSPGTVHLDGSGGYYRLPFDPTDDSAPIYMAIRGREITWANRISGNLESARVPYDGKHTRLDANVDPAERVLHFASDDGGFRAVRLSAIRAVGTTVHRRR